MEKSSELKLNPIELSHRARVMPVHLNRREKRRILKGWCTCGSGRKYKNCCGRKPTVR